MPQNVLVTGAGGYIGGSILEDLLSKPGIEGNDVTIFAAVRSSSQREQLREVGISATQLDLREAPAVLQFILDKRIDIVINTASSFDPQIVESLIKALGQHRRDTGKVVYFLHASIAAMFAPEGGWPYGQVEDIDETIIAKEEEVSLKEYNPVRATDILANQLASQENVKLINLVIPTVYGTGAGRFRRLSAKLPPIIKNCIKTRIVHRYRRDAYETVAHISDVVALYSLIVDKILQGDAPPVGFYFAVAHTLHWWALMDRLAVVLFAMGLIDRAEVDTWSSDEVAAKQLGLPVDYVGTMLSNSGDMIPVNPYRIGWKPQWSEARLIADLQLEVQAAIEFDVGVEATLFKALEPEHTT